MSGELGVKGIIIKIIHNPYYLIGIGINSCRVGDLLFVFGFIDNKFSCDRNRSNASMLVFIKGCL